jgi:hypothetical protein
MTTKIRTCQGCEGPLCPTCGGCIREGECICTLTIKEINKEKIDMDILECYLNLVEKTENSENFALIHNNTTITTAEYRPDFDDYKFRFESQIKGGNLPICQYVTVKDGVMLLRDWFTPGDIIFETFEEAAEFSRLQIPSQPTPKITRHKHVPERISFTLDSGDQIEVDHLGDRLSVTVLGGRYMALIHPESGNKFTVYSGPPSI